MVIRVGDRVTIEFTGKLDDNTIFDSSELNDGPLVFDVGAGQVLKGLENAVVGMQIGEEKKIIIKPEEAFGPLKKDLIKKLNRNQIPKPNLKKGDNLIICLPNKNELTVKVVDVDYNYVTIDLNHPLAGKELIFFLKIIGVDMRLF